MYCNLVESQVCFLFYSIKVFYQLFVCIKFHYNYEYITSNVEGILLGFSMDKPLSLKLGICFIQKQHLLQQLSYLKYHVFERTFCIGIDYTQIGYFSYFIYLSFSRPYPELHRLGPGLRGPLSVTYIVLLYHFAFWLRLYQFSLCTDRWSNHGLRGGGGGINKKGKPPSNTRIFKSCWLC